jgi:hypothetical protein
MSLSQSFSPAPQVCSGAGGYYPFVSVVVDRFITDADISLATPVRAQTSLLPHKGYIALL